MIHDAPQIIPSTLAAHGLTSATWRTVTREYPECGPRIAHVTVSSNGEASINGQPVPLAWAHAALRAADSREVVARVRAAEGVAA